MFICVRCRLVRAVGVREGFQVGGHIIHHLPQQLTKTYATKPVPPAPTSIQPIIDPKLEIISTAAYLFLLFLCGLAESG